MAQEFNQAILDTIGTVGAVALGGVLAVLITHRLTVERERSSGKKTGKRNFWHSCGNGDMKLNGGILESEAGKENKWPFMTEFPLFSSWLNRLEMIFPVRRKIDSLNWSTP